MLAKFWKRGGPVSLFTEMSENSQQIDCDKTESKLTLLREDSLANLTAWLENALHKLTKGTYGESVTDCFAMFDQNGRCLRMFRGYSQVILDGSLDEYCEILPRQGMMLSGQLMVLPMLELATIEKGCLSFPTPRVGGSRSTSISGVKHGDLAAIIGGTPNPVWVEWLNGFHAGWTDLNVLETL